jgi:hypothetical protein
MGYFDHFIYDYMFFRFIQSLWLQTMYICVPSFFKYEKTHLLILRMKRHIVCVSMCCNMRENEKHEKEE